MAWRCQICGEEHDELPLCFGAEAPWRALVPESDFEDRVELNSDLCVIDGETFFIRGHIEIPIVGTNESLAWSVWCSLSRESFSHCMERWELPDRAGDGYFGWLCTPIPAYEESTIHLKTDVISREPGAVPLVRLHPCEHVLSREQSVGITMKRAEELVHRVLHGAAG